MQRVPLRTGLRLRPRRRLHGEIGGDPRAGRQAERHRRQQARHHRVAPAPAPAPFHPPHRPRPHRLARRDPIQFLRQLGGAGVTPARVFLQAFLHHRLKIRRRRRVVTPHRFRIRALDAVDDLRRRRLFRGAKQRPQRQQLPQGRARGCRRRSADPVGRRRPPAPGWRSEASPRTAAYSSADPGRRRPAAPVPGPSAPPGRPLPSPSRCPA